MFCASCSSLALAIPAGARSIYVRVTSSPTAALSKLSAKCTQDGLERLLKARKVRARARVPQAPSAAHRWQTRLGRLAPLPPSLNPLSLSLTTLQNYLRPTLLRQKCVANAVYHKAKLERVKLVEELVLQKSYFPW
jgi:hypothetical protein